jgi:hypothetical protein
MFPVGTTTTRALILCTLALLGLALASEKAVEIRSRHAFIPSDASVDYLVVVPQHPDNRRLVFAAVDTEDGNEVRRTEVELDGAHAERSRWFRWRLPTGRLQLIAGLYGVHGLRGRDSTTVCVYSPTKPCGGEPEP